MICEKCGREMKRVFRMETWHCECRKFLVSDVQVKQEIWEHSPERAAEKFANIRDYRESHIVIIREEKAFRVKTWMVAIKCEAKKL